MGHPIAEAEAPAVESPAEESGLRLLARLLVRVHLAERAADAQDGEEHAPAPVR